MIIGNVARVPLQASNSISSASDAMPNRARARQTPPETPALRPRSPKAGQRYCGPRARTPLPSLQGPATRVRRGRILGKMGEALDGAADVHPQQARNIRVCFQSTWVRQHAKKFGEGKHCSDADVAPHSVRNAPKSALPIDVKRAGPLRSEAIRLTNKR